MNFKDSRVLMIGYVWPEPKSSAAGLRDMNLVDTFVNAGAQLTYVSPSAECHFSKDLQKRGIQVASLQANESRFDQFVSKLDPSLVIFDRFVTEEQFGWRVEENCPNAIRVLDTQDLHFLRRLRGQALKQGKDLEEIKNCHFEFNSSDTLRELGSIYRSDFNLILSSFEIRLLTERLGVPPNLLGLSRFHYSAPDPSTCPRFQDRADFVMIGNFRHLPNYDAVRWLHQEIWPLVRKRLPQATLSIYGAYPPREMMSLSNSTQGFFVKGPTPDQFETLSRYRLNLAPLRFGAGIKGKITDGWFSGTPVIATPIGIEGMCDHLPPGGWVGNSAQEFASKAIELYENEIEWTRAQQNGFQIIDELYSNVTNSTVLLQQLNSVRTTLEVRRRSNLIGAMLNYHLHRSTKYFSKWIEAKNLLSIKTPSQ